MRDEVDHDVERVIPAFFDPAESEKMRLVASGDASRRAYLVAFLDPGLDERGADGRLEEHLRPPCPSTNGQTPPDSLNGRIDMRCHRHRITKHISKLPTQQKPLATRPSSARTSRVHPTRPPIGAHIGVARCGATYRRRGLPFAGETRKPADIRGFSLVTVSTQCAPEETRTPNLLIRSQMLYPLSYGRMASALAKAVDQLSARLTIRRIEAAARSVGARDYSSSPRSMPPRRGATGRSMSTGSSPASRSFCCAVTLRRCARRFGRSTRRSACMRALRMRA